MKNKILGIGLLLLASNVESALMTNAANAGYLGDQLINYIKAKYLSSKYNIPFSLTPFPHSEKLILSDLEFRGHNNGVHVQVEHEHQVSSNGHIFYNVSYYCKMHGWSDAFDTYTWHSVLQDKAFMQEMRKMIALKNDTPIDSFSDDIMLAVHVRRPSNADDNHLKSCQFYTFAQLHRDRDMRIAMDDPFPFKFLPHQFYIDQIKRLANIFPAKNIRVYIFTDSTNPQEICSIYNSIIQDDRITFHCKNNHYTTSVAEDLVALSKFDYLIRSKSNFSQIADFIGNHKMVISSDTLGWYKNELGQDCLVAETVIIKKRDQDGNCVQEVVNNLI